MSLSSNYRKLVPLLNRVLIKKLEPVTKSQSGIIMSTKAETPNIGKIVSVGSGNVGENGQKIPIALEVGNTVLLPEFGGQKVTLVDGDFYLYRDNEILGVLEE